MEQRKWPLSRVAEELGEPIIRSSKLRRIMAGESANIDALLLVELFKLAGQSMDRVSQVSYIIVLITNFFLT